MGSFLYTFFLFFRGDLQWNAGEKKLTGGANWQPKVAPATWATGGSSTATMVILGFKFALKL